MPPATPGKSYSKWKKDSVHGRALRKEIIENNYIERNIKASDVRKNNPMYQIYNPDCFRANYRNLCKKILREREEDEDMNNLNNTFDGKCINFYFIFNTITTLHYIFSIFSKCWNR